MAIELDPASVHPVAADGAAVPVVAPPVLQSMATLLTGHILRDGEVVLLILKPSRWLILFSMLRFAAFAGILLIASELWLNTRFIHLCVEVAVLGLIGRLMWSILQWNGRLYVLTDFRILRLAGVFEVEVFDCPLRKVAQTRRFCSFRERLWGLGSIEIIPAGDPVEAAAWRTIREPAEVDKQIRAAIARAKNGGGLGSS